MKRNAITNGKTKKTKVPSGIPVFTTGAGTVFGFPNSCVSKLRYADTYAMSSTTGSIAKQVIRANSTFDPDFTGVGHQPLYRDTYATLYDHYAVVSADITATFISNATASGMLFGLLVDDDGTTGTATNTLIEQNNGRWVLIPNATGAPSTHTFKYHWDCKDILRIDPFASQTYKTAVGSNPTEDSLILLWSAPADGVSTTTTLCTVVVEYEVLWTELSTPSSS